MRIERSEGQPGQQQMAKTDHSPLPTWLITGTTGRVGRMLINAWKPPPARLLQQLRAAGSDQSAEAELIWDPLITLLPADLPQTDCLIAYAGITPAYGADLGLNAALAEATLRAAAEAGIPRVLMTSSSSVYGLPAAGAPAREDSPLQPVNDYGRSKATMEEVCARWRDKGLEVCGLRIGNVAGADVLLQNGLAANGLPLKIDQFTDGTGPVRSYIGPACLARATAALATHPGALPPVVNIGAALPVAMSALADVAEYAWTWQPAPATAHQAITLDSSLLFSLCPELSVSSDPAEMIRQWSSVR